MARDDHNYDLLFGALWRKQRVKAQRRPMSITKHLLLASVGVREAGGVGGGAVWFSAV